MLRIRPALMAASLWLLIGPAGVAGQQPRIAELAAGDDYLDAIAEARLRVLEIMEESGIPGASVAVDVGGEVVWSQGFGWADLEQRVPVTTLSRFRVGSVSKTMTATGLGLLLEEGLVDLDAPVQTYVPGFPEKRWTITTRQLGGHTAGIRHYQSQEEMLSDAHFETVEDGLAIFSSDTLLFEPGTNYSYSSYGWNLLSAVVESASGEPFLDFMRDRVFEPLGLRHTVPDQNTAIVPDRVSFYERNGDGALVNAPYVDNSYKWAGGGFLSTPEDLVRFGRAHMEPGFLRGETLEILQTSQRLENGEDTNYGIGWRSGTQPDGDRQLSHSGGSVGGTTLLILVPTHDMVVAGVVNISGPAAEIVDRVADAFEGALERR